MKARTIKTDYLARVEGEGTLYVKIKDAKVEDVKLKIFEPPRFFEALLRGRAWSEAPDITARICGISGLGPECRNPFKSIIVRSVEVLYAFWMRSHSQFRHLFPFLLPMLSV